MISILVAVPVGNRHDHYLGNLIRMYVEAATKAQGQCDVFFFFLRNTLAPGSATRSLVHELIPTPSQFENRTNVKVQSVSLKTWMTMRTPIALIRQLTHELALAWIKTLDVAPTHLLTGDADSIALPTDYFARLVTAITGVSVPHVIYGGFIANMEEENGNIGSLLDYMARKKICTMFGPQFCYFGEPNTLFSTRLSKSSMFPLCVVAGNKRSFIALETKWMRLNSVEHVGLFIDNPVITGRYDNHDASVSGELLAPAVEGGWRLPPLRDGFLDLDVVWEAREDFSDDFDACRYYKYSHCASFEYYNANLGGTERLPENDYERVVSDVKAEVEGNIYGDDLQKPAYLALSGVIPHYSFIVRDA